MLARRRSGRAWTIGTAKAHEGRVVLKGRGLAVADAEVSALGRPGRVRTDADGRFVLVPSPRPRFEVLVALPGGRYARSVRFDTLPAAGVVSLGVRS